MAVLAGPHGYSHRLVPGGGDAVAADRNSRGCVRQTAWRRWIDALVTIYKRLNQKGKSGYASAPRKKRSGGDAVELAGDVPSTLL